MIDVHSKFMQKEVLKKVKVENGYIYIIYNKIVLLPTQISTPARL